MEVPPPKLICIMAKIFDYVFKEKKNQLGLFDIRIGNTVLQYKTKCLNLKFNSQF